MATRKRHITKLTDVETLAVALVENGANLKKIAFFKSEEPAMDDTTALEIFKQAALTPADNENKLSEIFKEDTEGLNAAKMLLRQATHFKDVLSQDKVSHVMKMAGYSDPTPPESPTPNPIGEPPPDDEQTGEPPMPNEEKVEKSELSPEIKAKLDMLTKSNEDARKETEELRKSLKIVKDEQLTKDFIAKAKETYSSLPTKSDELGPILKALHDVDAAVAEKVEALLKASNELIKKSALLGEIGSSQSNGAFTAEARIKQEAEAVRKSNPKMTKEAAEIYVLESNPELYRQYNSEKSELTGKRS